MEEEEEEEVMAVEDEAVDVFNSESARRRDRGGSRPGRWTSTAEGPRTADSARGAG